MLETYTPVVWFNKRSTTTAEMVEHPGGAYLLKFEVVSWYDSTWQQEKRNDQETLQFLADILESNK